MINYTIDPEEGDFEKADQYGALLHLQARLNEFKESGYDDIEIYQLLLAEREKVCEISDEDFATITRSLNLEPQEPPPDRVQLLKQAIANKDLKVLWESVDLLAELKRLAAASYGVVMAEIKEAFGRSLNIRDFVSAIAQAERNQKLAEQGTKPDIASIAYAWARGHRDVWGYDKERQCWRMYNDMYWGHNIFSCHFPR